MSDSHSKPSPSTFERIEAALGATTHGRAFLKEFGQRARSEETALLLDAVARLENRAGTPQGDLDRDELQSLIGQVETALRDARLSFRGSMAPVGQRDPGHPTPDIPSFGRETTNAILSATELIQDAAWRMREAGLDAGLCDRLDDQTSTILSACKRQALLLEGLGTVERAIARADAFAGELRRAVAPPPSVRQPLVGAAPISLSDSDIEFGPVAEDGPADASSER